MPRSVRLRRDSAASPLQASAAAVFADLSPRGVRLRALAQLMRHDRGCGCAGCGARALVPAAAPVAQAKAVVQLCPICDDPECKNGEKCGRKDKNAHFAAPQGPTRSTPISQEEALLNAQIKEALMLTGLGKPRGEPVPGTPENSPPQSPRRDTDPTPENKKNDD